MSDYHVCVTSGYPIGQSCGVEAEGIVYVTGGVVVARFLVNGGRECRAKARHRAEAWIAADDKLRARMQARERSAPSTRASFWSRLDAA